MSAQKSNREGIIKTLNKIVTALDSGQALQSGQSLRLGIMGVHAALSDFGGASLFGGNNAATTVSDARLVIDHINNHVSDERLQGESPDFDKVCVSAQAGGWKSFEQMTPDQQVRAANRYLTGILLMLDTDMHAIRAESQRRPDPISRQPI